MTRFSALLTAALAIGCKASEEPTPTTTEPLEPEAPAVGDLLIEELSYSGAVPEGGTDHYYSDQFLELVNASDKLLDLSGVMLGDLFGVAGAINPGTRPDSFAASRPDEVVISSVWRFPEGAVLGPGEQLIVAHDGTNHRPFSTVDLSGAAFETYVADSGGDTDHPTVANMESVRFNGGYDWLVPVFGASIVVLAADAELGTEQGPYSELATAPADAVLDAVEALMDADSGAFKRLPEGIDAGFAWVDGIYVGQSLHRRRDGDAFVDTDNSGNDFEVGVPDPGRPLADGPGVFGDPWIELGTGVVAFESLADDDPIELVAGIQGGWHLDAAIRFGGFGPDGVVLVYEAVDTSAQPISYLTQATVTEASVLTDGDDFVRVGDRVVLDIRSAAEVIGEDVFLRVTAELDGQTWSDERRLVIVDED